MGLEPTVLRRGGCNGVTASTARPTDQSPQNIHITLNLNKAKYGSL